MPVILDLRENDHVIYIEITDPWAVQDISSIQAQSKAYLDNSTHKIHTLVIVRAREVPGGIFSIRPTSSGLAHPHSGQIIIVGAPAFLKIIAEAMFKIAHYTRSSFFDTEEQGWAYLRKLIADERASNIPEAKL